jgi:hypothetical protein
MVGMSTSRFRSASMGTPVKIAACWSISPSSFRLE